MRRGYGEGRGGEKKQLSDERLLYVILDYLVWRQENGKPGCTAYDITRNAPKLTTTQRQQRIEGILRMLEEQRVVRADRFEKATYYSMTEKGMNWYKTVVKDFWAVLEPTYDHAPRN